MNSKKNGYEFFFVNANEIRTIKKKRIREYEEEEEEEDEKMVSNI
mgnify:CR=1 FL=1